MIHPVIVAYAAIYAPDDDDETDSGAERQRIDLTGTTGGQFEMARQSDLDRITTAPGQPYQIPFGFQPNRRA